MDTPFVERRAYAKVNLDLRLTGIRPDGFHELSTVFQTIALHDEIRVEALAASKPLVLEVDDPDVPADDRNLVWRAAAALWAAAGRTGTPSGARVVLRKSIPTCAGLGGGSADAAVALVALATVWSISLARETWFELASRVGADVPFFLIGGTARGSGRGDDLEAWPDPPSFELVLATPSFGVSTADAYAWYDQLTDRPSRVLPAPRASDAWDEWLRDAANDLEVAVVARHPEVGTVRETLVRAGAVQARMSGSGSTVFGVFTSPDAASAAVWALDSRDIRVQRTRTIGRAEYLAGAFGVEGEKGVVGLPPD